MKEYLQYIRKLIWSSVKPSVRKWFWLIVVVAVLAFLVLFGILRYKMKFSVADSGYIGWLKMPLPRKMTVNSLPSTPRCSNHISPPV